MRRFAQAALLVLSGLGLLHAALFTDLYLNLVKAGMRPLLVASGAVLVVLGAWAAAEAWGRRRTGGGRDEHDLGHDHDHDRDHGHGHRRRPDGDGSGSGGGVAHGHDHSRVPRVAWLLFLPVLSLLFYAPPALGSYTASREPAKAVAVEEDGFDPLPATSPLPITLTDFTQRVQQDRSRAVGKRTVVMTGFVTPAPGGDGWYLTRIIVSCCAADASSVKVLVHGAAAPKADTWVNVTGTWHPGGTLGTASAAVALDARSVAKAPKPSNAYMDALPLTS
ncbi:TIGR03943 family putative permease subunit [Streptomyces sp. AK04-3B]|uniref:TIGR03943 family putative permease subunit n=1 Tax=Streptomyces sp. AK04-3B TaxID=3028650 RepID=UPI0029AF073B|nr:TIGR03943 family protein [Streptomyces sp. AK04-3B]MDX3799650.1 TIGR03943 family protein [Streptomyces sp. AK04-3B]